MLSNLALGTILCENNIFSPPSFINYKVGPCGVLLVNQTDPLSYINPTTKPSPPKSITTLIHHPAQTLKPAHSTSNTPSLTRSTPTPRSTVHHPHFHDFCNPAPPSFHFSTNSPTINNSSHLHPYIPPPHLMHPPTPQLSTSHFPAIFHLND